MIMAALSIPVALLCTYLSIRTWRMNYRRQAMALAAAGTFFLLIAAGFAVISWYSYDVFKGL